ncbi:MAG: Ig-like domain-containing protein [Lachnospira sp.]
MKKIKQFRRLRIQWKILIAILFVGLTFGGIMLFVNADSSITLKLSRSNVTVSSGSSTDLLYVSTLTGRDENHIEIDEEASYTPVPNNVEWTSSDNNIATFIVNNSDTGYSETATGTEVKIYGDRAGAAKITATYYSKIYDANSNVVSKTAIADASAMVYVPITVNITDSYNNDTTAGTIYNIGDTIHIDSNACETNKIVVVTQNDLSGTLENDGVVELVSSSAASADLRVCGGGQTTVTVRTQDGDGITLLSYSFTVRAKVEFSTEADAENELGHRVFTLPNGTKYMVLSTEDYDDFVPETIPSNVKYPSLSRVVYRSDKPEIASVSEGVVTGKYAGVATVIAGLNAVDTSGSETWYTKDSVNIVVPFKKTGNQVSNMNVSDKIQLSTTANPSEVTWSTSDNTVVQVDSGTGLVTAVGAGTATVYATRTVDDLFSVYGLPAEKSYQIPYEITVIDGFALSKNSASVNIGETIEINALVTNDATKDEITYVVTNQADSAGVIPTENLIRVVQSDDGRKFSITGLVSGTTHLTVYQNIKGVIKSATCVIYVTTPVGEVSINPSYIEIDRGKSDTVQLLFNPPGPTNSNVLWSSSNEKVATVEGDSFTATIKGVSGGLTTITVITEDGLKVATCTVYVREPVSGIVLNSTYVESTMAVGKYQLVASIFPEGEGVNRNVIWSSSDESVCKVDDNGLVTFVKPGFATIICKTEDGAFIATCNFVISIPVETIKLDYTDEIMSIGSTLRITAEVLPITASNRTVSWESSNTNVCIVDSNGLVKAVGTGSCTILCKSLDGGCTAMCNIYVKQPVTQVVLNTTDITVRKGQVFWLNATCLPENADNKICVWESRDTDVCTVENDGKVTAVGPGTTSIIATNVDTGITAYCIVTVTQPVTGIKLNSDYQELWVGAKYAIIPVIEPLDAENKNVTYFSSDESVATVDEYGVVTAIKGGSCVIEVTTEECHLTAACTIYVKEYVSSITLSENSKFLNAGATGTLIATVGTDTATDKSIIWSSSNNEVCKVDENGNLTALVPGTAVISATAADGSGVTATCVVRVVNPVTSITINPDTVKLLVGDSIKVSAVVVPGEASIKELDWTSSNESIAVVDEQGEIFAVGVGKCKVTATSKDGNAVKGYCWVYVTPVVNISSIKINSSNIYMLTGKSRQLSVIVRPANNTDSYDWYSTDTGIVTVNESGVITTVGPGVADVFVMSRSGSVTASCTVHSLALNYTSMTLEQYDSNYLDVIGTSDNITWRSSNPRVCTVTSDGKVTGRMAGTATITAVVNSKTLTCVVKVTNFRVIN